MHKQRGQLLIYGALGAAAVMLTMGIALKIQGSRLESCRNANVAIIAQMKANADAAKAAADAKEKADKLAKEKADAAYKKLSAHHAATARQLRDARAASSAVPAAPEGSRRPDLACFDRTLIEQAIGRLDEGVSQIATRSDESALRLKLSREWALDTLK